MKTSEIEVGKTYMFVATDNPTRAYLVGQPFKVESKKLVFRRVRKGRKKVYRFFNEDGVGARPEELAEMPADNLFTESEKEEMADRGHGFCPKCDYPLTAWGAASDGDGDIYDEIGCDRCEEVVRKEHASYCTCAECDPTGLKQQEDNSKDAREFPCTNCDTGELIHTTTSPTNCGSIMTYECNKCGYKCSFP